MRVILHPIMTVAGISKTVTSKCTATNLGYGITNDKIPVDVRQQLGADVLADGEMDTSYRKALFATRCVVEHGDVRKSDVRC